MIKHAAKITAIDPAAAGRAFDEMLANAYRRFALMLPDVFAARNVSQ
jgi:hypothetical protein